MKTLTNSVAGLIGLCALAAGAESRALDCDQNRYQRRNGNQERYCEMREVTLPAMARITVDSGRNGGISVLGSDRTDILVRARVEATAPSLPEAKSYAGRIQVLTNSGDIQVSAPDGGDDTWGGVSFEILVPRRIGLGLKTFNGGLNVADVTGEISFDVHNGGTTLARLGGTVRGKTLNGGLRIDLDGERWQGQEMDVSTVNGGVSLAVPANYSARLETATVNGRIAVDFPLSVSGSAGRSLSTTLGGGGPLVRAVTTNGGVSITRR